MPPADNHLCESGYHESPMFNLWNQIIEAKFNYKQHKQSWKTNNHFQHWLIIMSEISH